MFGRFFQHGLLLLLSAGFITGCKPSLLDPLKRIKPVDTTFLYSPALLTIQAASPAGTSSALPSSASFNGAIPSAFAITPALTSYPYLAFNTATGEITQTGTAPSTTIAPQTFTVGATTNKGARTATIDIQVLITIPAPTLSYAPNPKLFTVGTHSSITPTVGGGGSSSFAISGADDTALINAGLSFDTTTGTFSGSATSAMASRVITVTASNIGGSATFDLTVEALVPANLSYSPNPKYFAVSVNSSVSPTAAGTNLVYSIGAADDAALSAVGLAFSTSTGVISGAATGVLSSRTITITATNSVSSDSFDLTVEALVSPSISYVTPKYFTVGVPDTITPTAAGTNITFSIPSADNTALVTAGLSFNPVTGVIGGSAMIPMAVRVIPVTVTNALGSDTFNLTTAAVALASISYTPSTKYFTVGVNSSITPVTTGSGLTFSISGADSTALTNAGLSFNTATGAIGGTATSSMTSRSITVTATNVLGSVSSPVTVAVFANPTQLVLTGLSTGLTTSCRPYALQTRDAANSPTPTSSDRVVSLTGAGTGGTFYSGAGCTGSITQITIPAGQQTVAFYHRKTIPGSTTLTASSAPLTAGTVSLTITVAPPTTVSLTGTTTPTTASCAAYTITTKDAYGNESPVDSTTSVALTDGAAVGHFYDTPICGIGGSPITSTSVSAGTSSSIVYYKMPVAGSATLSANVSGIATTNLNITVGVSTPAKLTLTANPPTTQTAGSCLELTITSRDAGDNPINLTSGITVALSALRTSDNTTTGTFYSDAACSTSITSTTMMSSSQTKVVYYTRTVTSTTTQSTTLTASKSDGGFADGVAVVNFLPGLMYKMAWETVPAANTMQAYNNLSWNSAVVPVVSANTCSRFRLKVQDIYGNDTTAASAISLSLAGEADGAFYDDADTNCDAAFNGVSVAASAATSTYFRYRKPTSGAISFTATAPGLLTSPAYVANVSTGTPHQMVMATSPTTAKKNACTAFKLEVRDSSNIIIPAPKGTGYSTQLSQVSDAIFYSNSACTTVLSANKANIAASGNNVTFYYKNPTVTYPSATTVTFDELSGNLVDTSPNRSITISSGLVSNLVHTTAPTSYNFNTCQTYTLQSRDENALASNPTSIININLSTTGADGYFYTTTGNCSAQTSPVTFITIPTSTSAVTYYFRKNSGGAITNTVDATGGVTKNFSLAVNVTSPPTPPLLTLNGTTSLSIGICSPYTVSRPSTSGGLISVNLTTSGSVGIAFYVDPACTLSIDQAKILSGVAASKSFYVMGVLAETGTLGANATNYTSGTKTLTITP